MKTNAGRLVALASSTATNSTPDSKSEDNELNDVGMSMRDLIRAIRARRRSSRMVARAACCLGVGNDMAVCCSRASFSSRAKQPTSVYSLVGDELLPTSAKSFSRASCERKVIPLCRGKAVVQASTGTGHISKP